LYLIFSAFSRFMVEFIRLNPRILFGLSEAQVISVILMILGIYLFFIKKLPVQKEPVKAVHKKEK